MKDGNTRRRRKIAWGAGILLFLFLWSSVVCQILQWEFKTAMADAQEIQIEFSFGGVRVALAPEHPAFQKIVQTAGNLDLRYTYVNFFHYYGSNSQGWELDVAGNRRNYHFYVLGSGGGYDVLLGYDGILACTADLSNLEDAMREAVRAVNSGELPNLYVRPDVQ